MTLSPEEADKQEREAILFKIYTDSLMSDLIGMEDALTRAQTIHASEMKPAAVLWPIPTTMW